MNQNQHGRSHSKFSILPVFAGINFVLFGLIAADTNQVIAEREAFLDSNQGTTVAEVSIQQFVSKRAIESNESGFKPQLPPKDPTLGEINRVLIPKIGVDAPLDRGADSEVILKRGAWMVPEFKTPSGNALLERPEPTIIASHLFGYDDWDAEFRNQVAFAGLDQLEAGDTIEVIWQQRKYVYLVKTSEVSANISTYDHDLIVYTCLDLTGSDQRVIIYAEYSPELSLPSAPDFSEELTDSRRQQPDGTSTG